LAQRGGQPESNTPIERNTQKTYLLLIKSLTQRRLHLIIKESDLKKLRGKHLMTFENVKVYEDHGAFLGENNRPEEMPPAAGAGEEENK
jgi:hypothetical protein